MGREPLTLTDKPELREFSGAVVRANAFHQ